MNVSIDLRIEGVSGEEGDAEWLRIGESLHLEFNRRARDLALMIQGRIVYEIMEAYWPVAANDSSLPAYLQEYGRIWTEKQKVLVSNSRSEATNQTRVVGWPDALEQLAQIRAETEARSA